MIQNNRMKKYMQEKLRQEIENTNKELHEHAGAVPPVTTEKYSTTYYKGYNDGYADASLSVSEMKDKHTILTICTYLVIGTAIGLSIGIWL